MFRKSIFILILIIGFSGPGQGSINEKNEIIILSQFIEEALKNNPKIKSYYNRWEASKMKVPQVGSLKDPVIGFGILNLPAKEPHFNLEPMTGKQLTISQIFPFPGKLTLMKKYGILVFLIILFCFLSVYGQEKQMNKKKNTSKQKEKGVVKAGDYLISFIIVPMAQHKKMLEKMKHNIPVENTSHHLDVIIKNAKSDEVYSDLQVTLKIQKEKEKPVYKKATKLMGGYGFDINLDKNNSYVLKYS